VSEPIEPALTSEEWAERALARRAATAGQTLAEYPPARAPGIIALANDSLRDSDTRKITWEMVDFLRFAAELVLEYVDPRGSDYRDSETTLQRHHDRMLRIADALASYLPPRER